jgi:ABC-type Fe3+ transport system permease subunit
VIRRALTSALLLTGWAVFVLAFVWPTIALIAGCLAQGQTPEGGFAISARQWGLLWRSGWLSAAATVVCVMVSLPGAYLIGQTRRIAHQPVIAACQFAVLLCPPMVYAFGWDRILPKGFDPNLRCIGVWALWAWPIPVMVIGAAWSGTGRRAYEAASLVASRGSAFIHAALPTLFPHVALSALILFVIFFGDYGVPSSCGLTVYATELLGWASSSARTIDVVWPAIAPTVVTLLVLLTIVHFWRRCAAEEPGDGAAFTGSPLLRLFVLTFLMVSGPLPMGTLVARFASFQTIIEAFRTYAFDLGCSLGVAMVSGVAAVAMGFGVVMGTRLRGLTTGWAMVFGALPGALIGEALVTAFNRPSLCWLYDHWPIVALAYVARFGWIGLLVALLVLRHRVGDLSAQARTDGATESGILSHLLIPMNWALPAAGIAIVAALSLADLSASALVRVPTYNPIAYTVMDKFHRFEDGMMVALSLWLVGAAILPALFLAWALRRRG